MTQRLSAPVPLERAGADLDLAGFSCGDPSLDRWLRDRARRAEGQTSRTYVVTHDRAVAAYYCIAAGQVSLDAMPSAELRRNMPHEIPVFVLGRLAVATPHQKQGLARSLLAHCLRQCLHAAEVIGARGLVVHPVAEAVEPFYTGLGFAPLRGERRALILPFDTIRQALKAGPP